MSEGTIKVGSMAIEMVPTTQLRWVREIGIPVLQQLWAVRTVDRTGLVTIRHEWRVVPTEGEGEIPT
jgi:hypothetical protein